MPLRSVAFLLYFFGSCGAAFIYPMVGVVCYVVLYQVYPQTTWWGKPLDVYGIRYSFVCGLCLTVGMLLNIKRLPAGRQIMHPVEIGTVCVFLAMLLSSVIGVSRNQFTELYLDKMAKVVVFLLVMSRVVVTRDRLWIMVLTFTAMAWYLGHEATNAPPGAFHRNRVDGIGGPDFREASSLAIHLSSLLPFVAIALSDRRLHVRIFAVAAAAYAVNGILLCRARSAFLGAVIAAGLALFYVPRRYRSLLIGAMILGAAGMLVLSDDWFWNRMLTIASPSEERDQSAAVRLVVWRAAWDMFRDHVMGVGVGQFQWQIRQYSEELNWIRRDAHNTYILCACELGVFGLMVYLATLGGSWWTLNHAIRRARQRLPSPGRYELIIFASRISLVVYAVSGLFVSRLYTEGAWWLIMLPVCIHRAVESEIHAEARVEEQVYARLARWLTSPAAPGPALAC